MTIPQINEVIRNAGYSQKINIAEELNSNGFLKADKNKIELGDPRKPIDEFERNIIDKHLLEQIVQKTEGVEKGIKPGDLKKAFDKSNSPNVPLSSMTQEQQKEMQQELEKYSNPIQTTKYNESNRKGQ
jgi:hypothetical protein